MPIRIVLADDHEVVREALRSLLEREGFEVVGEAADGARAVKLCARLAPDVAVLDRSMEVLNGEMAAREIRKVSPKTRTLMLTMYAERAYVVRAVKAGVRGYVLKSRPAQELIEAIREVHAGNVYLSPSVSEAVVDALSGGGEEEDPLTAREREILKLVAEGNTTREISRRLGISGKTVESHRARILEKLHLHDTASLVRYAVRHGLIEP